MARHAFHRVAVLQSDDVPFGEIAGIAVNSKGHVFVFSRGNSTGPFYMATASQSLEFDEKRKFVRETWVGELINWRVNPD